MKNFTELSINGIKVFVKANKNHGICDITLQDGSRANVLSEFQGRQYDDPNVIEHLENVLCQLFKAE